jgi:ankyrin repeat protein
MSEANDVLRAVYRKDVSALERSTREEVNARDEDGRTPLMHAVLAEDADAHVVRTLLERGADVSAAEPGQQWTALHFAARDQLEAIVQLLVDAGAAVDAVDVFGNTPLWRSVTSSAKAEVARRLVAHGADPRRKNRYGVSPLDKAREIGRADLVALFGGDAPAA